MGRTSSVAGAVGRNAGKASSLVHYDAQRLFGTAEHHPGELRVYELEQKAIRVSYPKLVPRGHDLTDAQSINELLLCNQKRFFAGDSHGVPLRKVTNAATKVFA